MFLVLNHSSNPAQSSNKRPYNKRYNSHHEMGIVSSLEGNQMLDRVSHSLFIFRILSLINFLLYLLDLSKMSFIQVLLNQSFIGIKSSLSFYINSLNFQET